MLLKYRYILCILTQICALACAAQTDSLNLRPGGHYRLYLNNEESISGFVVDDDGHWITLETRPELVRTEVRRSTVVKAELVSARQEFEAHLPEENRYADQYLISGSALPFEPEQVSATAHWLFLDQSQYAFNGHCAIHVNSIGFIPCGLGFRLSYSVAPETFVGGGFSAFAQLGGSEYKSDLIGFVTQVKWTHGTSNRNVTLSAGLVGVNPEILGAPIMNKLIVSTPFLSGAFCKRVSPGWAVVLEGHVLPEEGIMIGGAGFKLLLRRSAITLGGYGLARDARSPALAGLTMSKVPVPYLGYSWKFD